jgi:hypothetical protein
MVEPMRELSLADASVPLREGEASGDDASGIAEAQDAQGPDTNDAEEVGGSEFERQPSILEHGLAFGHNYLPPFANEENRTINKHIKVLPQTTSGLALDSSQLGSTASTCRTQRRSWKQRKWPMRRSLTGHKLWRST